MTTYSQLSFSTGRVVLRAHIEANQPVLIMGSPGVGKTTIVGDVARELGRKCWVLIASTYESVDFGGLPKDNGEAFDRIPCRQILEASKEPGILFFDEITTASPQVQAALLRGILERVFGDVRLHPDTVIVAAANPVDQAPGGYEMAPPLTGRFSIYDFAPKLPEVQGYFNRLGNEDSQLRELALDLAATWEHAPDLLQLDPPQAAINEGAKWASPRDWDRALNVWATCPTAGDDLAYQLLAGSVGEHAAAGFMGIRKLRVHLPGIGEIVKDPAGVKVPDDPTYQVGAIGLLANVASQDCYSAWIYAARLRDEIGAAAARALLSRKRHGAAKRKQLGNLALTKLLGRIGADLGA